MVGKFEGILVGYKSYAAKQKDKDGNAVESDISVVKHVYSVFCGGRKDKETGLFIDDCKVVAIIEDEQVLPNLEYGLAVEFYGETRTSREKGGKTSEYLAYSDIRAVGA